MSPLAKSIFDHASDALRQRMFAQANENVPHHPLSEAEIDVLAELDEQNTNRPMTLPVADAATISHELSRLGRPTWKGRPHE